MIRARACTVAVLMLAAAPAAAQGRFDGLWRGSPTTDCTRTGRDGGALKIEDDVFYGVDAQCVMSRPVDVRDMDAALYDMQCEGSGGDWSERALFMRAADGGLIMLWNGFAFKYDACPADPVAGTVTRSDDVGVTGD